jgi:hypothetical protein
MILGAIGRTWREVRAASAGVVILLAWAMIGFVWLSVALANYLAQFLLPAAANAVVGAVFLAPLAIAALVHLLAPKRARASEPVDLLKTPDQTQGYAEFSGIVQNLAEKSPLTAIAVASLAGLIAARFPAALTIAVQMLRRRS